MTGACGDRSPADQARNSSDIWSTTAPSAVTTTRSARIESPGRAIALWLDVNRGHVFTENDDPYRGACPSPSQATDYGFLCSSLVEEVGAVDIHQVGAWGTNWGADLLLRNGNEGWEVIDGQGWPEPERNYGPPWSPLTAITRWWLDTAEKRYGPGALHIGVCAGVTPTDQPLLCSALVDSDPEARTYSSGLVGREPDVYLRLELDSTTYEWRVAEPVPSTAASTSSTTIR